MKAMPTFALALLVIAGFVVASPAQDKKASRAKTSTVLAEARAAADLEGDLANALSLYEKAAEDSSLALSEHEEALYEAALLCRKLKQDAKARQILSRLSGGVTEWAVKGKALLRGKSSHEDQDAVPRKRIQIALSKLFKNTHAKEGLAELKLIGEPAIPFLVKELNAQRDNLVFVANAVEAIATLGGPRVKGWFASVLADKDVYFRRAVVQKLATSAKLKLILAPYIHQLIRDEDKRIVQTIIRAYRRRRDLITKDDVEAVLDRNDVHLATSMIKDFKVYDFAAADPAFAREAAKKLIELLPGLEKQEERDVVSSLSFICRSQPETAFMFLNALVASFSRDSSDESWAEGGIYHNSEWKKTETVSAREFLNLAREFPEGMFARFHAQSTTPKRGFWRVRSFVMATIGFTESWTPADVPAALKLLELGVYPWRDASRLEQWIAEHATSEQLPLILEHIMDFKTAGPVFDRLLAEKGREDFVAPLEGWIDAFLGPDRKIPEKGWDLSKKAVEALVHQKSEEGYDYAVGLVRSNPALFTAVARGFEKVADDPAILPFLAELIVLPSSDERHAADARYPLWVTLYRAGRPESIPALIAGGRRGIRKSSNVKHIELPLFETTAFSGADQARIWKDLLHGREEELGHDVYVSLRDAAVVSHTVADLPPEVKTVLLDATFAMAPRDRRTVLSLFANGRFPDIPHRDAIFARVLRELGPAEQTMVLGALDAPLSEELVAEVTKLLRSTDRDLVFAAMRAVRRLHDPRFAPAIRKLLASEDGGLRSDAVLTLVAIEKDHALDAILPLAKDESSSVRWSVFSSFMVVPDRRAIPLLVEALRDPVKKVRGVAESTLKRLQFYFDQKERWERWMKGVGLDAGSAADALLRQAAPDQPKMIRVTAIRSLGTLGVAETLPILIRFMQEGDPDIARAAKKAVDQINREAEKKPVKN